MARTFATFARLWSAGMVPIIERSGGWPGFRYPPDLEAGMVAALDRFPRAMERYRVFALVDAVVTLGIFIAMTYPTVWLLEALQRRHGSLPDVVVAAALGANTALALGVGVPAAVLVTCAIYQHRPWNADLTSADAVFGRRLFARLCQQTTRLGALVCLGLVLVSLWPAGDGSTASGSGSAEGVPIGPWDRLFGPLVAAGINAGTFWFYYGKHRGPE